MQSAENYDLQEVLLIVQPKKLINATAYLFERLGDVHGAFKLLCDDLRAKVQTLDDCYRGQHVDEEESEEVLLLKKVIRQEKEQKIFSI